MRKEAVISLWNRVKRVLLGTPEPTMAELRKEFYLRCAKARRAN